VISLSFRGRLSLYVPGLGSLSRGTWPRCLLRRVLAQTANKKSEGDEIETCQFFRVFLAIVLRCFSLLCVDLSGHVRGISAEEISCTGGPSQA
jgi:hypothetical protein